MSDVHITVTIILGLCCCLLFIIPFLKIVPKIGTYISSTWCLVVVNLCMALGCVIDLNHLSNEVKQTVILGAFILTGIYIFCAWLSSIGIEKILQFVKGSKAKIKKGDLQFILENNNDEHRKT